jgi:hypothetical protein
MPFSDFRLMAIALLVIAGCALATTLRQFGFYRWARFRYADAKAWLFDQPEDDAPWIDPSGFPADERQLGGPPDYRDPGKPAPRPRRKRRPKA